LVWEWKQRLACIEGLRIGIVWQGNPQHKGDRIRSITLTSFEPLAGIPGVTQISLQRNFGAEQLAKPEGRFNVVDLSGQAENIDGWLRTAAIVSNLDLVIGADTSVLHLAAAMGVPTWMAIATSPDWRWLLNRDDTPWYPTMRLFRQQREGDWDEVFGRIAEALRQRIEVSSKSTREPASDLDQRQSQELLRKAGDHLKVVELPQAQGLLEQAIKLDPMNAPAYQDLGVVCAKQGRLSEGVGCFRRALELAPESPGLYSSMGLACYHSGWVEEAISHLRKAIWLGSSAPETHKNLALALTALPDPAAAEGSYWAALRLNPDDAEAHYRLSQVQLMQGKFAEGWLESEWRWRWNQQPRRQSTRPRWLGQSLEGERLLISAEDDPRDTVQFARYADLLHRQGACVVLECQSELVGIC